MARNYRETGKIQQSYRTARRYEERIRNRFTAEKERWQSRVEAGLDRMDTVFSQAFVYPQLAPQLQLVTTAGAQLSEKELQQVAYYLSEADADSKPNSGRGNRKERRAREKQQRTNKELSPGSRKFLMALLVLMLFLAACSNVGSTGPTREEVAQPTQVVQVEPTATIESEAEAAPKAPTPTTETQPATEETDPIEIPEEEEVTDPVEEETPDESPQVDLTRIPQPEIIQAAREVGVTLTPEAVAEFQTTRESGSQNEVIRKVMYRLTGSADTATVEIARSDADGNVTYEVVPTPGATAISEHEQNGGVLLVMAEGELAYTIDTNPANQSEVTAELTPEPESAPEPEIDPSENVELAQAAVGPEVQIASIGTIEAETLVPKGETGETVSYQVAYNEHGIPVARYSNENGGDYEWIAGGPFAKSELNDGLSQFPGNLNGLNFIGINVKVSQRLDFDGSAGHEQFVLLDANGNQTNFVCESAVVGHYLNANGEEEMGIFPVIVKNTQTGQILQMQTFAETPLPQWELRHHLEKVSRLYYLTHSDQAANYYDNPQEVNYNTDPNAIKPQLGFGDEVSFPFRMPGYMPSGNDEYIDGANFMDPLVSSFYNNPNYGAFVNSGELDNFGISQEHSGLPVVNPATVINWSADVYR